MRKHESHRITCREIVVFFCSLALSHSLTLPALCDEDNGQAEPRPVAARLLTRWAKDVSPENVHAEYPRPQLVRPLWKNLNGLWQFAIRDRTAESDLSHPVNKEASYDGQILVPFPVESTLSRVARDVGSGRELQYRRTFTIPADWKSQRVLLHFGAVDWEARVIVNGEQIGRHQGGFDAFTFDITNLLLKPAPENPVPENELIVIVWDPTDDGTQPRGKQVQRPEGIWYTSVTGIWQTVWLEPVPRQWIESLRIESDLAKSELRIQVLARGGDPKPAQELPLMARVRAADGRWAAEGPISDRLGLSVPGYQPWSPAQPRLYSLEIELLQNGKVVDRVESYFGMREIRKGTDSNGLTRLLLNGEPLFQFGPLDQGWWPDGLYTAPSDAALRFDLEMTKRYGYNMVRKHVKVEPARWYYHCDQLGLLVWQDMPSGDANARWPLDGTENGRSVASSRQFELELAAMIDSHLNHPCIVTWVPFNEAWGQFETERWTNYVKNRDPSRIVISASGGNDFGTGDVRDIHFYPQPEAPPMEANRAAVLGEFGGLGLPIAGHTWQEQKNWGYRQFKSQDELQTTYLSYLQRLRPMIESGLSAAVYTQTTDVEIEVNGLMTYDRAMLKLSPEVLAAAHSELYAPLRQLSSVEKIAASTIAYWRFEEGDDGSLVAHDRNERTAIAARDSSAHRNHLYAYSAGNAPRHSRVVPNSRVASLQLDNRGSLDDSVEASGATRDLYSDPGRSQTHMDAINSYPFCEWTLEASFRLADLNREQTIVGEDGKPTSAPEAPLQLYISRDNRVTITAIDRRAQVRSITAPSELVVGTWYHVAVVADGKTMRLWALLDGKYQLQGECDFIGGLILHDGTWTIGRGFHDGALARDARAWIDEVRVCTRALPREWLLWSPH